MSNERIWISRFDPTIFYFSLKPRKNTEYKFLYSLTYLSEVKKKTKHLEISYIIGISLNVSQKITWNNSQMFNCLRIMPSSFSFILWILIISLPHLSRTYISSYNLVLQNQKQSNEKVEPTKFKKKPWNCFLEVMSIKSSFWI